MAALLVGDILLHVAQEQGFVHPPIDTPRNRPFSSEPGFYSIPVKPARLVGDPTPNGISQHASTRNKPLFQSFLAQVAHLVGDQIDSSRQ